MSARDADRRTGIARALSKLGVASRSEAARWVEAGRVAVNGRVVRDPETPVRVGRDRIVLDGVDLRAPQRRYLMLNKPRGLVTTAQDEAGRDTVYRCLELAPGEWVAPVGRLDKASEGLLLFSNDSAWAARITDPQTHLAKVYHVQIDRLPDATLLAALRAGVDAADGTHLAADAVELLRAGEKNAWLAITLSEGKNRHIRRLLEAFGIGVLRLIRVAIGPLTLGDLPKGAVRALNVTELRALAAAMGPPGSAPAGRRGGGRN